MALHPNAHLKVNRFTLIAIFLAIGLIETVLAYFLFSRADDHGYFFELANAGLVALPDNNQDLLNLKSTAAGIVFYVITSPSRWMGGHELAHLLWLRAITLIGFLCALSWFRRKLAKSATSSERHRAETTFMILVSLYPGQVAWTASLLRDGIATALFFIGLTCLRKDLRLFLAPVFLGGAFALRPEYALIMFSLMIAMMLHIALKRFSSRIFLLLILILFFSIFTHSIQADISTFGQLAFGDGGFAYPVVTGAFDLVGYWRILLQALIDPIALSAPSFNLFGIAESMFFIYLLWQARSLLRHSSTLIAAFAIALLFSMWYFAYFEVFVSGFSRHRICLEVALIAMTSLLRAHAYRLQTIKSSQ